MSLKLLNNVQNLQVTTLFWLTMGLHSNLLLLQTLILAPRICKPYPVRAGSQTAGTRRSHSIAVTHQIRIPKFKNGGRSVVVTCPPDSCVRTKIITDSCPVKYSQPIAALSLVCDPWHNDRLWSANVAGRWELAGRYASPCSQGYATASGAYRITDHQTCASTFAVAITYVIAASHAVYFRLLIVAVDAHALSGQLGSIVPIHYRRNTSRRKAFSA